METQGHFSTLGTIIFKAANKISKNQKICRLLKYQTRNPFSSEYEDVDGSDLLNNQIIVVPKIPDESSRICSYVVIMFGQTFINPANTDFNIIDLQLQIICPFEEWILDSSSLRPYLLANELDKMFNGTTLTGLGKLNFVKSEPLVLSSQLGGYILHYTNYEFNR